MNNMGWVLWHILPVILQNTSKYTPLSEPLQQQIKQLAKQYAGEFISIRRYLHANPELSYQEFETSKFVQQKLNELNIPFEIKATTGVIGLLEGKNPGKRCLTWK